MTTLVSLIVIASGISVVTLIAAIAVIVLLFTGGAGAWFRRQGRLPRLSPGCSSTDLLTARVPLPPHHRTDGGKRSRAGISS